MSRLWLGAAFVVAGVVGAGGFFSPYGYGGQAFAQAQSGTATSGNPATSGSSGLGNGGSGFGAGGGNKADGTKSGAGTSSAQGGSGDGLKPAAGSEADGKAGASAQDRNPDEAAKIGNGLAKTVDEKAASDKDGDAAKADAKAAAPEAAAAMAATSGSGTIGQDPEAIGAPAKVDLPNRASNGSLGYAIDIDVPAFRGLEPKLSLTYDSSRKTKLGGLYQGWLGYGWGLDGIDVIERASPGYGMPVFDGSDVFLLNGMPLVPCGSGVSSPSCTAGGTHATENESYRRIKLVGSDSNKYWEVTDRDGTVSIFKSVGAVTGTSDPSPTLAYEYRWLLSSVTDTNGNKVEYGYYCLPSPVCYATLVSYNGTTINLYLELRPDLILMGNGRDISETRYRVKSIAVRVSGQLRGAYALTYDEAPFSRTSRLTKVTRFGLDATVDPNTGVISGGSSKRIAEMSYQDTGASFSSVSASIYGAPSSPKQDIAHPTEVGDLNFDGRDEIFGDHIVKWTQRVGGSGGSDVTYHDNTKLIHQFTASGSLYATKSLAFGNEEPAHFSGAGRFVGGKPMDFANVSVRSYTNGHTGQTTYTTTRSILQSDGQLGLTKLPCEPAPPAGYEAVCAVLPQSGAAAPSEMVIADADGDGVDTLFKSGEQRSITFLLGLGDFLGNGRQQPVYGAENQMVIWKGTFSGDTGVLGPQFSLYCSPKFFGTSGGSCVIADVNGDGASDIVRYGGGNLKILLSTGVGFREYAAAAAAGRSAIFRDYDNDGRMDLFTVETSGLAISPTNGTLRVFSLQASGGTYYPTQFTPLSLTASVVIGDFNGDGLPDFINRNGAGGYVDIVYASNAGTGNPNLLRNVTTELGGTVAVEYTPSSRWENIYLPQVVHAVTKLSVGDGRGQVAVTDYGYSGGKYDPVARRFLGFASVVETKPSANGESGRPTVATSYRQDVASYGLPEMTTIKDGGGNVRKQIEETYQVNATTKPYWVRNTRTRTTLTEDASLTLRVEREFDQWGNVQNERDHGREDVTGDEQWRIRDYVANTTAFITSRNATDVIRNTFDYSKPPTKATYLYYDDIQSYWLPPTKGNLTQAVKYVRNEPLEYQIEKFSYDSYGNKISMTDGAGNRTEWDYDADYHLYPVKERAPKYFANGWLPADTRFVTTATYNPVCGGAATITDQNGVVSSYKYDPYCRLVDYRNTSTGYYRTAYYTNEGVASWQYVTIYEPGLGSRYDAYIYDGLGRVWRHHRRGDVVDPNVMRITETDFDQRGNISRKSHPYFYPAETPQFTQFNYDWSDRPTKTTNPDGSSRYNSYHLYTPTSIYGIGNVPFNWTYQVDELGRKSANYYNAWGDIICAQMAMQDGSYNTQYRTYDQFHRLIQVRDNTGSVWNYSYDMIGNRLSASDPDLGAWSYKYDGANRLIQQTDARGAVAALRYDQLGRLLMREVVAPPAGQAMPANPVLAYNTYDEVRAGYFNIGQLTTSQNGSVVQKIDYGASGAALRREATIDGVTHRSITTEGTSGVDAQLPIAIRYEPNVVEVGTTSAPWTYNGEGLLSSIPGYITSISYEADNQTRKIVYANGATTWFTYSPTRRWLTRVVTTGPSGAVLMDNTYSRDFAGRITSIDGAVTALDPAGAKEDWVYAYNNLDWLMTVRNAGSTALDENFAYQSNGNMTWRSRVAADYTYPAPTAPRPHAPLSLGSRTFAYDANGNTTSDGVRTMVWDEANRLKTVSQSSGTTLYSYGPDGARVKKTSAFGTTLYPSADVEIDPATPGAEKYTRYPHADIKVVNGNKFFLHRDHLASVRFVTDAAGAVVESTGYAAYGERLNTGFQTQKGYIGERFDPETGLLYLNARYMDPTLGRYVPKDEIGEEAMASEEASAQR